MEEGYCHIHKIMAHVRKLLKKADTKATIKVAYFLVYPEYPSISGGCPLTGARILKPMTIAGMPGLLASEHRKGLARAESTQAHWVEGLGQVWVSGVLGVWGCRLYEKCHEVANGVK